MASNLPKFSLFALLLGAALLASSLTRPAVAFTQATTVTTNETLPLNAVSFNSCNGEAVTLTGEVHIVTHFTTDTNGGTHYKSHQNFENVTGTGSLSLITYRGVSNNNHTDNNNGSNAQQEFTNINRVRLISQGPADNLLVNITVHATINANGQATSTTSNFQVICTG